VKFRNVVRIPRIAAVGKELSFAFQELSLSGKELSMESPELSLQLKDLQRVRQWDRHSCLSLFLLVVDPTVLLFTFPLNSFQNSLNMAQILSTFSGNMAAHNRLYDWGNYLNTCRIEPATYNTNGCCYVVFCFQTGNGL
jgi:hypothetical protein